MLKLAQQLRLPRQLRNHGALVGTTYWWQSAHRLPDLFFLIGLMILFELELRKTLLFLQETVYCSVYVHVMSGEAQVRCDAKQRLCVNCHLGHQDVLLLWAS